MPSDLVCRRTIIAASLGAAGAALLLPVTRALAAAKTAKADVMYQYQPKGDQHCGLCASFIRGDNPLGAGSCQIVDGNIPQDGWCALFSKRK
jgi:hypothetical protein